MKKFIKYKWPVEVIHALGDMGMIAPGIIQKKSYRLIEKSQSFILNVDSSKDRLLSIIPPLLASMIHEEKTQIILLGHKEELLSSSFDMKEYNKYNTFMTISLIYCMFPVFINLHWEVFCKSFGSCTTRVIKLSNSNIL